MAGQRPGPSLALVQKRGWLELAQSCCRAHLGWHGAGQDAGGLPRPDGLPGPAPIPGVSPRLQGTPAAVGIGRTHAVPAGGVHSTRSDFHPGHLEAEAGAQIRGAAGPSQGSQHGEGCDRLGKLRLDAIIGETQGTRPPCRGDACAGR